MNFKKGDIVDIKPEFKEEDDHFLYVLIEEPDGGRVKIQALGSGLPYPSVEVALLEWLMPTGNSVEESS